MYDFSNLYINKFLYNFFNLKTTFNKLCLFAIFWIYLHQELQVQTCYAFIREDISEKYSLLLYKKVHCLDM